MHIQNDAFVTIEYTLTLENGEVIDQSSPGQPLPFIFGSGQIVPGLEKGLLDKEAGFKGQIKVTPEEGYGPQQPELIREIPKENFPEDAELRPGMMLQASTPQGVVNFQIKEIGDEIIKADFNHPLAGKTLLFDIKVEEVRQATEEDKKMFECGPGCGDTGCSSCGH